MFQSMLMRNLTHIAQEESYSHQISKYFWLKDANVNSKFFYSTATSTKISNFISSLTREYGNVVHDYRDKCDVVIS